ncbi:MAG: MlaD family protein [Flavipsychrobacter sp.]|nr:MlaD family protein [Flavipsychrobacter sp.]
MSLSREARIGLLVTISLLVFFAGFYFLKGSSLLSSEKTYYCFFANVQGLQGSSNVQIRGLNVGRVSHTQLIDNKGVKVSIAISKDVEIPQGTIAKLASADLLGTKIIKLDLGSGPGLVAKNQELPTAIEGGLVDNLSAQMTPLLVDVRGVISTLDTLLVGVNNIVSVQNQQAITGSIASLNTTTANFAAISASLRQETGEINGIIHNANSITNNLANNNDKVQQILANTAAATDKLAKAPIKETFENLQKTTNEVQGILNKINNNQGSLGAIVNDKALYTNLTNSLASLNLLMADLKDHPSRYVNISVFGKKKK